MFDCFGSVGYGNLLGILFEILVVTIFISVSVLGLGLGKEIGQKDNHQLDDLYLVIMLFYCMRSLTIIILA